MVRLVIVLITLMFFTMPAMAKNWVPQDRVPAIGNLIVKKNSLLETIVFEPTFGTPNNNDAIQNNTIQVNIVELEKAVNDNEVAYIVSKELSEVLVKNIYPKNKQPTSYDKNAMTLDLMVNSGYNPLAGITYLSRISETAQAVEAYNYLTCTYPSKIKADYKSDEYQAFLGSIEPELDERSHDIKKLRNFEKTQTKNTIKRFKQISKYNEQNNPLAKWDLTYGLLLSITEPEE